VGFVMNSCRSVSAADAERAGRVKGAQRRTNLRAQAVPQESVAGATS